MSLESRLAGYPQNHAASAAELDYWIASHRTTVAAIDDERITALALAEALLRSCTRERLSAALTVAVERLVAKPQDAGQWYLTAYRSARQRAENHLAALVEVEAECGFLRTAVKERDDEVAQLQARITLYAEDPR